MEFGAREMMLALGVLVVLAIVLDVIRRVRNARYDRIHMSKRKQPIFDSDVGRDEYGSELPGGGARVVSDPRDSRRPRQCKHRIGHRCLAVRPPEVAGYIEADRLESCDCLSP